jgi:hypothetical protein
MAASAGAKKPSPTSVSLGDDYRVGFVDRRDHGDSPPAERFDFDALTEDICALFGDGLHLVATPAAAFSAYSLQPAGHRRVVPDSNRTASGIDRPRRPRRRELR